jgi:hypothetical protein
MSVKVSTPGDLLLLAFANLLIELNPELTLSLDHDELARQLFRRRPTSKSAVNEPSDQTGERPVSDAILVFPKRN